MFAKNVDSKRYEPPAIDLKNRNSSHTLIVELTGSNKTVLEVGTSTGYLSKILKEQGNRVIGVEIDAEAAAIATQYCDQMITEDVETFAIENYFEPDYFDVVIFGDVLEHLRWPHLVLEKVKRHLKPNGYLVVSIPNIAHGDIILNLLVEKFRYTEMGLLDITHLRFFALDDIIKLFEDSGYQITDLQTTTIGVGATEANINLSLVPKEVLGMIKTLPHAQTYQFVFQAYLKEYGYVNPISLPKVNLNEAFHQFKEDHIAYLEGVIQEHGGQIGNLQETINQKDAQIFHLEGVVREKEAEVGGLKAGLAEKEREVGSLNETVTQKDAHISHLEGVVSEKEAEVQGLRAGLAEKESEVGSLNETVGQRDAQMADLEGVVRKHEAEIEGLRAGLDKKDSQISHLESALSEKEVEIESFNRAIGEKEARVSQLSNALSEKDSNISSLEGEVREKEAEIGSLKETVNHIYNSHGWKTPLRYYRVRDKMLPQNSKRRLFAKLFFKALSTDIRAIPRLANKEYLRKLLYHLKHSEPKDVERRIEKKVSELVLAKRVTFDGGNVPPPMEKAQLQQTNFFEQIVSNRFLQLQPIRIYSVPGSDKRITLVTDSINAGSLYGGVATTIIFATLLAERLNANLRVITRTEKAHTENFLRVLRLNGLPSKKNVDFAFCSFADGCAETDLLSEDVFVTTSWWTTQTMINSVGAERLIYILQEDERMFYPMGDDYIRCEQVMKNKKLRLVINSQLLYDHFVSEGFDNIKESALWFEPSFSPSLFFIENQSSCSRKNFFFYARPNNLRNLFYFGLEVINKAVEQKVLNPNEWVFHFFGKDIPTMPASDNMVIKIHQNLTLSEYASLARFMNLGLSLMASPHPSYPPLDLAASGVAVVTNKWGLKQGLERYSRNIISADLDVDSLIEGLQKGVELAQNQCLRRNNVADSSLLRDWRISFKDVLEKLAG